MHASDLVVSAEYGLADLGRYSLSLFSFPEMPAHGIAEEVGRVAETLGITLLPNTQMRAARAGDLRAAGYGLEADNEPPGHVTLELPDPPTDEDWTMLDGIFSPPQANPIARKR